MTLAKPLMVDNLANFSKKEVRELLSLLEGEHNSYGNSYQYHSIQPSVIVELSVMTQVVHFVFTFYLELQKRFEPMLEAV